MLRVSCADVGDPCRWQAAADTADELRKKIWAHAKTSHKAMLAGMSIDDRAEFEAHIDALIEMQGG